MALSFPYPTATTTARPDGNGCVGSCVHRSYCPAYYWLTRYNNKEDRTIALGTSCGVWSNNPSDRIIGYTPDDLDQNDRLNDEGLLIEADSGGFTDAITGAPWRNEQ